MFRTTSKANKNEKIITQIYKEDTDLCATLCLLRVSLWYNGFKSETAINE